MLAGILVGVILTSKQNNLMMKNKPYVTKSDISHFVSTDITRDAGIPLQRIQN